MGISTNSHGKKSDKETQSPLLKIFKEIMSKEKNDPEKQNLLDQKEIRRLKQYSESRLKIDRQRDCDRCSSDYRKRSPRSASFSEQKRIVTPVHQSCGEALQQDPSDDDACTCLSCALKRILGSELICIGCLLLIFITSITIACAIVFNSVPSTGAEHVTKNPMPRKGKLEYDSERLKRKIEIIDANVKNELNEGVFGQIHYDKMGTDAIAEQGSSILGLGQSFSKLSDSARDKTRDKSDILDNENMDKLKNFYDKLVETDAKIKKLKKLLTQENKVHKRYDDDKTPDRTKRSLKLYHEPKGYVNTRLKRGIYNLNDYLNRPIKKKNRNKRNYNDTKQPAAFVIERKQLIVKYRDPDDRKKLVAKCSHSPKEIQSHQHEHHLKHPFYQNTQRLDELLDKFLNRNIPEIVSDPFAFEYLFKHNKNKCKHTTKHDDINTSTQASEENKPFKHLKTTNKNKYNYIGNKYFEDANRIKKVKGKTKNKNKKVSTYGSSDADIMKILEPVNNPTYIKNMFSEPEKNQKKITSSTTKIYENTFTLPTMTKAQTESYPPTIVTETNKDLKPKPSAQDKVNIRHLMQMEGEEEENLGYEDFKEVLTDDIENEEDVDRRVERKRREQSSHDEPHSDNDAMKTMIKNNAPGMQNPNWKGPMPLYPDELSTMIKQHSTMDVDSKLPNLQTRDNNMSPKKRRNLSDVEYVEDYLDSKYDKLVEMAQAYSDYGVLEGKKGVTMDKKQATDSIVPGPNIIAAGNRVQLFADWHILPRGLLGKKNKQKEQYGTTMAISSTPQTKHDKVIARSITLTDGDIGDKKNTNNKFATKHSIYDIEETRNAKRDKHVHRSNYDYTFAGGKGRNLLSTFINTTTGAIDRFDNEIESFYKYQKRVSDAHHAKGFTKYVSYTEGKNQKQKGEPRDIYNDMYKTTKFDTYQTEVTKNDLNIFSTPLPFKNISMAANNIDVTEQGTFFIKMRPYTTQKHSKTGPEQYKINIISTTYQTPLMDVTSLPIDSMIIFNQNSMTLQQSATPTAKWKQYPDFTLEFTEALTTSAKVSNSIDLSEKIMEYEQENLPIEKQYLDMDLASELTTKVAGLKHQTAILDPELDAITTLEFEKELNKSSGFDPSSSIQQQNLKKKFSDGDIEVKRNSDKTLTAYKDENNYEGQVDVKNPEVRFAELSANDTLNIFTNSIQKKDKKENPVHKGRNCFNKLFKILRRSKKQAEMKVKLQQHAESTTTRKAKLQNEELHKVNGTINNLILSDFFSMISNWFQALQDSNKKLTTLSNVNAVKINHTSGHKTRRILSINEENSTENANVSLKTNITKDEPTGWTSSSKKTGNVFNVTTFSSTVTTKPNNTVPKRDTHTTISMNTKDSHSKKVKRNVGDSNLIFWNDIYDDDEYGIRTNTADNSIRIKLNAKQSDFLKKSGRWVQDKIKKFADNLKARDIELPLRKPLSGSARSARNVRIEEVPEFDRRFYGNIYKRSSQSDPRAYQMSVFKTLNANMEAVCKKAAQSVKQISESNAVKEDSNKYAFTSSLIQQLVRLLTDLMDYQVQAATCTKLPPDLKRFLEWMVSDERDDTSSATTPSSTTTQITKHKSTVPYSEDDFIEELIANDMESSEGPTTTYFTPIIISDQKMNAKLQYDDTIRSVQELLEEYEDMVEHDKFDTPLINKQPYEYSSFNMPNIRRKRKMNRYIKKFGKKHTRTTASYYDGLLSTDMRKNAEREFKSTGVKSIKRNLKDVYYKAVAEAKKYASCSQSTRITAIDYSSTQNAKIHNN